MNDAMTETIPPVTETSARDAALAESAEIIWCPAIEPTADSGPNGQIVPAAVTAQIPATMVEATETAQFIETARPAETAAVVGSEGAAENVSGTETVPVARSARGRHAAPRSAGTRPSAAGLAKRGRGRHAATRPAGGVGGSRCPWARPPWSRPGRQRWRADRLRRPAFGRPAAAGRAGERTGPGQIVSYRWRA